MITTITLNIHTRHKDYYRNQHPHRPYHPASIDVISGDLWWYDNGYIMRLEGPLMDSINKLANR